MPRGMEQPAKKSYFFGAGYRALKKTIIDAWRTNLTVAAGYWFKVESNWHDVGYLRFAWMAFYLAAAISVFIVGSATTLILSVLHVALLFAVTTLIYLGFSMVWVADSLFLWYHKVFIACPICKEKSAIPIYLCPGCGEKHTKLVPGVYGILKRRCNCGTKLPTTFFNGRPKLGAICPACGEAMGDKDTPTETTTICLPVVGAASVGKTAFINAFTYIFIELLVPSLGWIYAHYDESTAEAYNRIKQFYRRGAVVKTAIGTRVSASDFSFLLSKKGWGVSKTLHIYDIAGEVFTRNDEIELQKQYQYCHAVIFILDPFAIEAVFRAFEDDLSPVDKANVSTYRLEDTLDSFLIKLKQLTGNSGDRFKAPVAVVINKIDSAHLGIDTSSLDAMDTSCRKFLADYGCQGFLTAMENRFSVTRFFACSAIGHERDSGAYDPRGVTEVLKWVLAQSNRDFERQFTVESTGGL